MEKFGYLDRLNGMETLPYWKDPPCNNIAASEGSFFPPRAYTNSNIVYVYDKDLCRIMPLEYVRPVVKDGKTNIMKKKNFSNFGLTFIHRNRCGFI